MDSDLSQDSINLTIPEWRFLLQKNTTNFHLSSEAQQNKQEVLSLINILLNRLQEIDSQFHFVANQNIWIVKPANLSQGRGESIASRPLTQSN